MRSEKENPTPCQSNRISWSCRKGYITNISLKVLCMGQFFLDIIYVAIISWKLHLKNVLLKLFLKLSNFENESETHDLIAEMRWWNMNGGFAVEVSFLDQERRMKLLNCDFVERGKWFPPTWNHRSAHMHLTKNKNPQLNSGFQSLAKQPYHIKLQRWV